MSWGHMDDIVARYKSVGGGGEHTKSWFLSFLISPPLVNPVVAAATLDQLK